MEGYIVGQRAITPVDSAGGAESILAVFTRIIEGHLEQIPSADLLGVGIGFPGPFDYEAGVCLVEGVEKFGSIYGVNLRQALRARLDRLDHPVLFRNDAEAAIVGESCYGAGRPYRRLVGITLGTGCGSAFIVDGQPVTSGDGVPPNGWLYPLSFRGMRADDIFSRRGLEDRLRAAGAASYDVREAAGAARAGNAQARQVFEAFGEELGVFLHPFTAAFHADALIVLGRIAGAIDLFGPALRQALPVPVLQAQRGEDAALLGAADLIFKQCQETL
jgi:glucokinase